LLLPIDTKLAVWIAHIKMQRGIATHMALIKIKLTVTKSRISVVSATYICVMSGTNLKIDWFHQPLFPYHLFIAVFNHILST